MDEALVTERIAATLEQAFARGVDVQECAEVPGVGTERKVHKLVVTTPSGDTRALYAKTGTDSQVRLEAALYQSAFGSDFSIAPRFIGATERDGVHCFITEEVVGEPVDGNNRDHAIASLSALALLHREARRHVAALLPVFAGPTRAVSLSPQPQKMFDRIFMVWGLATAFGITHGDLAVFYEQRVLDLILSEEPTLVHGDFGLHNLLIDPATLQVRFIDFGFSNLRAASSDLMYEFDSDNSYGEHLDAGLRAYYETSDQEVTYEAFRIRHAYWHASCYADMFAWQMTKEDLADEDMRNARQDALERIRNGGRYIAAQIAAA